MKKITHERRNRKGSVLFGKEVAKARSEEAGGILRSFSKEVVLDVVDAVGERTVVDPEGVDVFLEAMDFVLLTQRSHAQ